jgi:hypothetical protein
MKEEGEKVNLLGITSPRERALRTGHRRGQYAIVAPEQCGSQIAKQGDVFGGVVVPKITNPFFPQIIQGIELAAAKAGYAVILCSSDEHAEREAELIRVLTARRVDGIILCSPRQPEAQLRDGGTHCAGTSRVTWTQEYCSGRDTRNLIRRARTSRGLLGGRQASWIW